MVQQMSIVMPPTQATRALSVFLYRPSVPLSVQFSFSHFNFPNLNFMELMHIDRNQNQQTGFEFWQWFTYRSRAMPLFNIKNCRAWAGAFVSSDIFYFYLLSTVRQISFHSLCCCLIDVYTTSPSYFSKENIILTKQKQHFIVDYYTSNNIQTSWQMLLMFFTSFKL